MKIDQETYAKGLALLTTLHGGQAGGAIVDGLKGVCPDYAAATIQFVFGEVFSREGLDLKSRELAIIATLVTLGSAMPQLRAHIEAALNVGATKTEIIEVIFQTAVYAGFACVTNAMFVAKETFAHRGLA